MIAEHHYLGLGTPVGRLLRYVVRSEQRILGCISFSEAAWKIAIRDQVLSDLGFEQSALRNELIANNRFLILPNVSIPNLASRVLSQSMRLAVDEWHSRFGFRPQFVETFVDPSLFSGACYLAANWIPIGYTKGYAKRGGNHSAHRKPKILFMRATSKRNQKNLLQNKLEIGQLNFDATRTRKTAERGTGRNAA